MTDFEIVAGWYVLGLIGAAWMKLEINLEEGEVPWQVTLGGIFTGLLGAMAGPALIGVGLTMFAARMADTEFMRRPLFKKRKN